MKVEYQILDFYDFSILALDFRAQFIFHSQNGNSYTGSYRDTFLWVDVERGMQGRNLVLFDGSKHVSFKTAEDMWKHLKNLRIHKIKVAGIHGLQWVPDYATSTIKKLDKDGKLTKTGIT